MVQIKWMNQAIIHLLDIKAYIAFNSPHYAMITINKIRTSTRKLKAQPLIGKIVREFEDVSVREIIEGNYRIIYHTYSENEIWILAIIHNARDLKNIEIEKPT